MTYAIQGKLHNKQTVPFYLMVAALFIVLKLLYRQMDTDDLYYFLLPIDHIIKFIAHSDSTYLMGQGYYHTALNMLIDKSCSGFNFFVLCYSMLAFLFIQHAKTNYQRLTVVLVLLPVAYLLCVFVNSARILSAILIQTMADTLPTQHSASLHQAEGVFIYLFFLIAIYALCEQVLLKRVFTHV